MNENIAPSLNCTAPWLYLSKRGVRGGGSEVWCQRVIGCVRGSVGDCLRGYVRMNENIAPSLNCTAPWLYLSKKGV